MPFTFDPSVGRYRDAATGRLIREEPIRRALDQVIDAQASQMRALTQSLIDGQINLATWQAQGMALLKAPHVVATALANGGWAQLDQSDFGWAGQRIRREYSYWRELVADIASGRQPLNGMLLRRSTMYIEAARATHREAERRAAKKRGLALEKSNLGVCDHCALCISEASRGWQPVGTLLPVGSRTCLSRCHCWFSFRVAAAA